MRSIIRFFSPERIIGFLLIGLFVALRAWDPGPLEISRLQTFDLYQNIKPRQPSSYPVAIVDIDEKSLDAYGQWPWPRDLVADLVQRIHAAGGRAIAFDFLFAEPDRMSPDRLAAALPALDAEMRRRLERLPTNEARLAESFAALPVVLGRAGTLTPDAAGAATDRPIATIGGDPRPFLVGFPGLVPNMPVLEAAAAGSGLFSVRPERDGVIRRVATVMDAGGRLMPSLGMELLRVTSSNNVIAVRRDQAGVQSVRAGDHQVPTDRSGQIWVHFSPRDPNRYVSASDVLDGALPDGRLKDKLVLIGTSSVGLFDLRATPLSRVMPGVEIHAQQLEAILTEGVLNRPHYARGAEIMLAVTIGLLIVVLTPMLGALPVLGLGGVVAVGLVGLSWYLFDAQGVLLDIAYPLISSIAVFASLSYVNYIREESRRTQIRSAFGQYLSPTLVSQLTQDPQRLVLGGETRELTILFSDVRGFTSIAEGYRDHPQELTQLMNRLLTPLSNAIIERNGTIDKYMGDAVMAFWNAPLDVDDHAAMGCEAALSMLEHMDELNATLAEENAAAGRPHQPLNVGIGLATGSAVVGNMGSDLRFDYTVLGDSVNLASRLEGLTAQLGVRTLVSQATAQATAGRLATLEVDLVQVKGKDQPERVFTIVGAADLVNRGPFVAFRDLFGEMLTAYRAARFDVAGERLARCRPGAAALGLDDLVSLYERRLAAFVGTPPPADWSGVFRQEKK